jgi:diguanylate cyclase
MGSVDREVTGQHECRRSLALAEAVLSSLREIGLAPTPRNYEIWYTHALKENGALSRDIDTLLAAGGAPAEADLERLYGAHFGAGRILGQVETIGTGLNARLGDVIGLIAAALGMTSTYGDCLDAASRGLTSTDDPAALVTAVRALATATLEMRQDSLKLKARLDGAMREISELQQGLQTIRMESRIDPLTELGNRKHFDETMNDAVRCARERGEPLSLLMIDIDHFKSFNDTYGHATGDQVLRLVAATLKHNIKGQGAAARYGGEEFAIVLPNIALEQAATVGDQVRRAVMARELKKKSTGEVIGRITISVGVAALLPYDSKETFIERADNYLYAAKRGGRNRVVGPEQFRKSTVKVA